MGKKRFALTMACMLVFGLTSIQAQVSAFEVLLPYITDYSQTFCAETADGHYLVSPGKSMILKLSQQGDVVDELSYTIPGTENAETRICALLNIPEDPTHHIAIAEKYQFGPNPNAIECNTLHIFWFDDNLRYYPDDVIVVDLSDEVKNYAVSFNARFILDEDGCVCFASNAQKWDDSMCLFFVRVMPSGLVTTHFDHQFNDYSYLQVCDLTPKNGHYDMVLGYQKNISPCHLSYCEVSHDFETGEPFHFSTCSQATTYLQYDNLADSLFMAIWSDYDNCVPNWISDSVFLLPVEIMGCSHYNTNTDHGASIWKLDSDFNIIKYTFFDVNHFPENHMFKQLIARNPIVINNDEVYFCYTTYSGYFDDPPRQVAICKLDTNLNLKWKRWYGGAREYHIITDFIPTSDGGCLLSGEGQPNITSWRYANPYVLKITPDGYCSATENDVPILKPYCFFPNPACDILRLEYSPDVTPCQAELYDVLGRVVGTQNNSLENIDMSKLYAGTYTLRIVMDDGKTYSDKVVKE